MKAKIDIDFFSRVFYPSRLKSHGDDLYFIGKTVDMENNAYDSDLYRLDGGKPVRLTFSRDVRDFSLTDTGIIFASAREQKDKDAIKNGEPLTVFQLLPYDGGEAREYLRLPYTIGQTEWLPDGRLLFRGVLDHTLQSFLAEYDYDMAKALKAKKEQDASVTVIDEMPFWFNGEGFINKIRTALYLYDGKETYLISNPYANVDRFVLNADKTKALYSRTVYEHTAPKTNVLCALDIATKKVTPMTSIPEGQVDDYTFGEDGTVFFLHTPADAPYGRVAGNPFLCRINIDGTAMRVLDNSGVYNYYSSVGTDVKLGGGDDGLSVSGGNIGFLATLSHSSHIVHYSLQGDSFTQVSQAEGMVTEYIPYQGGYAMVAMRGNNPGDIYALAADGQETRLSAFNDELMDSVEVITPLPLTFTNKKGNEIQGWVMPPVGYVPGKVYPAILDIHGGPKTAYGSVLFHEMQYWCAQGYAVLFCNPTGSDGKGSAFADIRGQYGTVDYDDIMQFVDEATTRFGFISAVNIGVTGGSYGGFMTNWIIGHTDRFRAAASQRSISNWTGFFNTSDIGYTFGEDQMQGTPWNAGRALWQASPIKYANKVKTPTLFIHSEEDYRCNMFEGLQMYSALRYFGVDTRLCLFKGETHELSRSGKPKNRIRRLQEITRWMDLYLKG